MSIIGSAQDSVKVYNGMDSGAYAEASRCTNDLLLAGRIDDDTRQIMQQVNADAMLIMANTSQAAAETRATSERQNIDTRSAVNLNGVDTRRTVDTNAVDTRRTVDTNGLDTRRSIDNNGLDTRRSVDLNGTETRREVQANAAETRGLVKNFGEKNLDATERFGLFTRDAVDRNLHAIDDQSCKIRELIADYGYKSLNASCHTDQLIAEYGYKNLKEIDKVDYHTQLGFKDTQKELLKESCETREVVKDKTQILERQASDNFAVVTRQAAENSYKIEIQSLKNNADLKELANKLAFDAQKQAAECCCEMKELVINKANHTDELIRKLDENRIRDELANTKNELVALKIRAGLAPAPVSAICL